MIKGQGVVYVDHVPYDLSNDTLMVVNPNQISWFEKGGLAQNFEVKLITFTPEYFSKMPLDAAVAQRLQGTLKHFFHDISPEERPVFERFFQLIEAEYHSLPSTSRDRLLAPLISALLARISLVTEETLVSDRSRAYVMLYRDFLEELERNFKSHHQVEDYAGALNVTDRKLNRACHAMASTSAGKIIQNRIDFEAKRLLRNSSYTAKEIGYELGFSDPAHFSKFFKRHNGYPPGGFRK